MGPTRLSASARVFEKPLLDQLLGRGIADGPSPGKTPPVKPRTLAALFLLNPPGTTIWQQLGSRIKPGIETLASTENTGRRRKLLRLAHRRATSAMATSSLFFFRSHTRKVHNSTFNTCAFSSGPRCVDTTNASIIPFSRTYEGYTSRYDRR